MNSSNAFREATAEDADAIADQIVASREKVRDYDGGPEGTADRFMGCCWHPSPEVRQASAQGLAGAARRPRRWTRRLPPHDKAGLRG